MRNKRNDGIQNNVAVKKLSKIIDELKNKLYLYLYLILKLSQNIETVILINAFFFFR